MKNVTIALFAVLFAAVLSLFIIVFSRGEKSDTVKISSVSSNLTSSAEGIAFFDIDSVVLNFDMYVDMTNSLLDKQSKAESKLNSEGKKYQSNVASYQEKVNKGLVTRATASEMETDLYSQQEALLNLTNQLQNELSEEESAMNNQIIDYIATYLEENKETFNYKFIFARSFGGNLFYADQAENITQRVIVGINAKYAIEKKK